MRSLLFVPGDSRRKIEKALGNDADALILDLEDSVARQNKPAAREIVAETLGTRRQSARDAHPALWVRINALDSGLAEQDLAAVIAGRPAGIVQPKTQGGGDVGRLSELIGVLEADAGIEAGSTRILAIATETARSLFHLGSYDEAGPRLAAMTWGAEDLSADLGALTNRREDGHYADPYKLARTLCLIGAVAAGVQPLDGIHANFRDLDGLRRDAERGMRDGFTGKVAIHPAQVPVINEVFTPSDDDVARARRIVDAFAEAGDIGVVGFDGEMLDRPHLLRAERLLRRASR